MATLKGCIDEEKIRKEENIALLFKLQFPPTRILTKEGLIKVKIAKICISFLVLFALYLIYLKFTFE